MTIRTVAFAGDSLTVGALFSMSNGAKGTWSELVRDRLANITGLGPLISPGLRGTWLGNGGNTDIEWTFAGAWTTTAATDAWDKAPYGADVNANKWGNGSGVTALWTKPRWMPSIVAVAVDMIDKTSSGDAQYRIDGGTWTNIGQTLLHDNKWLRFHLATAVTSTIEFRCYNGAAGVDFCLVGVEPYFVNPLTATAGLVVQNIAISGSKQHMLFQSTSGDRMAFFGGGTDGAIKLGTGSPVSPTPNAGTIIGHINDVADNNASQWSTDHTSFYNRVTGLGAVAFWSPYEASNAAFNTTNQATYRTQTATDATSLGIAHLNLFTAWSNLGFGSYALENAAGLLNDLTHPSQTGMFDLAPRFYWWLRNNFFSAYNGYPSSYPSIAKQAAVQYAAKAAAVQYAAGLPISVG